MPSPIHMAHQQTRGPARSLLLMGARWMAAAFVCVGALASAANAQQVDCRALQAQIQSAPMAEGDGRAQVAADKQRAELDRTLNYGRSIGCDRRQFLFFGDSPPAQCADINQRVASMRGNLARLEAAALRTPSRRDALVARYNATCGRQAAAPQQRGFFDQLFGGNGYTQMPLDAPEDNLEPTEQGPGRGSKAVCVRLCDGAFFPISYAASRRDNDQLTELCHAQCPFAQTSVYTYSPARDIVDAVSLSGDPYTSHPNALRFRKVYDPSCTCRPAGATWAEVLVDAEKLIERNRGDVIVTPEKAEELSRPKSARPSSTVPERRVEAAREPGRRRASTPQAAAPEL